MPRLPGVEKGGAAQVVDDVNLLGAGGVHLGLEFLDAAVVFEQVADGVRAPCQRGLREQEQEQSKARGSFLAMRASLWE